MSIKVLIDKKSKDSSGKNWANLAHLHSQPNQTRLPKEPSTRTLNNETSHQQEKSIAKADSDPLNTASPATNLAKSMTLWL
jgi:hypothetical protein